MAFFAASQSVASAAVEVSGNTAWQPVTLQVTGPVSSESNTTPNPFLDIRLDVTLTAPNNRQYTLPGFFAGDGFGNGSGSQWQVRFTPEVPGEWHYEVSHQQGDALATAAPQRQGQPLPADGFIGSFEVAPPDVDAPGFLGKGPLRHVGQHYLQFANGEYWLKGGINSPENFLAYRGFDNTVKQSGGTRPASLPHLLHAYDAHVQDWRVGDPLFHSSDTGVDSKGIIGAVNYLSQQGVNSMYMLLLNLGGDGREVYPFINPDGSHQSNTHYDVSKLHQWNQVFAHMQAKGIAAHLVLGEQELDNTQWLDNGTLGTERKLYYREMAARFGYLNAVKWNLSEESRFSDAQHLDFARYLRRMDAMRHPISVHTWVDKPAAQYEPLLGHEEFEASSIQFHADKAEEFVEAWRARTRTAGHPWVIDMDELGPGREGLKPETTEQLRRDVLYPVLFSGGNIEWYFNRFSGDIATEDFRPYEAMFRQMRAAREQLLEPLPFETMQADDRRLLNAQGGEQLFRDGETHYLVYAPQSVAGLSLDAAAGEFDAQWFDPRSTLMHTPFTVRYEQSPLLLPTPPGEPQDDWVLRLARKPVTPELGEANSAEPDSDNNGNIRPLDADNNTDPAESASTTTESAGALGRLTMTLWLSVLLWRRTRRSVVQRATAG